MQAKYWRNTDDDNDRVRRRQAEFLVHNEVPWTALGGIAVKSAQMRNRVLEILGIHPECVWHPLEVRENWYY